MQFIIFPSERRRKLASLLFAVRPQNSGRELFLHGWAAATARIKVPIVTPARVKEDVVGELGILRSLFRKRRDRDISINWTYTLVDG